VMASKPSSQSNLKGKTSRISLSSRSPDRSLSPGKKENGGTPTGTSSPRLHVRPKKFPLANKDISVHVKRIIGSSVKSHRELSGSIDSEQGSAIVYSAGATVVHCKFSVTGEEPEYRYYCAPPDQEGMNDLVSAVAPLNLVSPSTPPSSKVRYQNHTPRARASMGFDIHRGAPSPNYNRSSPSNAMRNRSKSAKDRIRLLGCVAISPDQAWIAGGEVSRELFTLTVERICSPGAYLPQFYVCPRESATKGASAAGTLRWRPLHGILPLQSVPRQRRYCPRPMYRSIQIHVQERLGKTRRRQIQRHHRLGRMV
jgi:hypothetical protein